MSVLVTGFEMSTEINAPVGEVFVHVTDLEREPKFHPGLVTTERITDGPIGFGTKWREVYRYLGIRIEFVLEIVEFEPNRKVAFEGSRIGPVKPRFVINFEHVNDDGSKVTFLVEPEVRALLKLVRHLRPLGIWYGRRDLRKYFTKLNVALKYIEKER